MGGFLLGACCSVLIALAAYFVYLEYDVATGSPGDDISVIVGVPDDVGSVHEVRD